MRIKEIHHGFETIIKDGITKKVVCWYNGTCEVVYEKAANKILNIPVSFFNSQYGVPISGDGKIVYVTSWEDGVFAYSVDTNELLWRYKSTRIQDIVYRDDYIVVKKYGESIIKLNAKTGELITLLKSTTISSMYYLRDNYIFIEYYRGKLAVVDIDAMEVVKDYPAGAARIVGYAHHCIQEAYLKKNKLIVEGGMYNDVAKFFKEGKVIKFKIVLDDSMNL